MESPPDIVVVDGTAYTDYFDKHSYGDKFDQNESLWLSHFIYNSVKSQPDAQKLIVQVVLHMDYALYTDKYGNKVANTYQAKNLVVDDLPEIRKYQNDYDYSSSTVILGDDYYADFLRDLSREEPETTVEPRKLASVWFERKNHPSQSPIASQTPPAPVPTVTVHTEVPPVPSVTVTPVPRPDSTSSERNAAVAERLREIFNREREQPEQPSRSAVNEPSASPVNHDSPSASNAILAETDANATAQESPPRAHPTSPFPTNIEPAIDQRTFNGERYPQTRRRFLAVDGVGQASDETKDGPATRDSDDQSNRRTISSETPSAVNQARDQGNPPRDSTSDGNRFLAQGQALFTATATTEQLNQAFDFFMKAAELGSADAEHRVGVAYATGKGVQKNESEAVRWYQKSVDHGFAEAQCDLGVRYLHGQGVKKDERTGLKLIRKAAAQGYQEAIDILKNRGLTTDGQ